MSDVKMKRPVWARNMLTQAGYHEEAIELSRSARDEETQKRLNRDSIKADYQRRAAEEQKIKETKTATAADILGPTHRFNSGKLVLVVEKVSKFKNLRLSQGIDPEVFDTVEDLVAYLEVRGYSTKYWREPARSLALHNAMAFPVENIQMPGSDPKCEHSSIDDDVVIDGYANF